MGLPAIITKAPKAIKEARILFNATKHIAIDVKAARSMGYFERAKALKELASTKKSDLFILRNSAEATRYSKWHNRTGANFKIFIAKKSGTLKKLSKKLEEYVKLTKNLKNIDIAQLRNMEVGELLSGVLKFNKTSHKDAITQASKFREALLDASKHPDLYENTIGPAIANLKNMEYFKLTIPKVSI